MLWIDPNALLRLDDEELRDELLEDDELEEEEEDDEEAIVPGKQNQLPFGQQYGDPPDGHDGLDPRQASDDEELDLELDEDDEPVGTPQQTCSSPQASCV